jgi:hypothetical protein
MWTLVGLHPKPDMTAWDSSFRDKNQTIQRVVMSMSTITLGVVGAGLFFLFIFVSGIWLSRSGRPLNVMISTIHKLISLAAGVFLVVILYQINRVTKLGTTELIASMVTGLLFLGTGISGGLLSTDKPAPAAILRVHQILPVLTVLSTAATLYLLPGVA